MHHARFLLVGRQVSRRSRPSLRRGKLLDCLLQRQLVMAAARAARTVPQRVSLIFSFHQHIAHVHRLTHTVGVATAQTLEGISAQILQNQKDLPVAIAANQAAGAAGGDENASAISGASILLRLA